VKRLCDNECRRCGKQHDEFYQLVDSEGRWAVAAVQCDCGHSWTTIHTAPMNLRAVRAWLVRGCQPPEGPAALVGLSGWRTYRLEGVGPSQFPAAS
jgi:hypothetical protein